MNERNNSLQCFFISRLSSSGGSSLVSQLRLVSLNSKCGSARQPWLMAVRLKLKAGGTEIEICTEEF